MARYLQQALIIKKLRFWDAVTGETKGKLADFTPQQLGSSVVEKAAELVPDLLDNMMEEGKAHAKAVLWLTLSPDRQLVASGSRVLTSRCGPRTVSSEQNWLDIQDVSYV